MSGNKSFYRCILSRVALVAQQPIVVKLSRGRSVGLYVRRSVYSALWKNGGLVPDVVWHHRSDGSGDEASIGVWQSVHGNGYFLGRANLGSAIVTNGDFTAYMCNSAATRPSSQIILGRLVTLKRKMING